MLKLCMSWGLWQMLQRYQYLLGSPPRDRSIFDIWIVSVLNDENRMAFAVIDLATEQLVGSQSFLRITPEHGSIEIGAVLWGPKMARTRLATEAFYLFSDYALTTLGYRRYEWKCNNANEPSRKAAERFGFKFEGIFRNNMVLEGINRDTTWYSIIDSEWPALKESFEQWLHPSNFDEQGQQLKDLRSFR